MKAPTLQSSMKPSSEFRHGASSSLASSTHFRFQHGTFGELSEEEDNTVTMVTMIEQHKKEEGTPPQFQHNNLGSKKEEHVTIQGRKEEEYVAIQEEGTPMQLQHVTIQIEPDAPPTPEVAGIWVNGVMILLLVPAVIFGLRFSGVI